MSNSQQGEALDEMKKEKTNLKELLLNAICNDSIAVQHLRLLALALRLFTAHDQRWYQHAKEYFVDIAQHYIKERKLEELDNCPNHSFGVYEHDSTS